MCYSAHLLFKLVQMLSVSSSSCRIMSLLNLLETIYTYLHKGISYGMEEQLNIVYAYALYARAYVVNVYVSIYIMNGHNCFSYIGIKNRQKLQNLEILIHAHLDVPGLYMHQNGLESLDLRD